MTKRLVQLEKDFDVRCEVKPVYPLAVRTPEFFAAQDPLWVRYLFVDIQREAAFLACPSDGHGPTPSPSTPSPAPIRVSNRTFTV